MKISIALYILLLTSAVLVMTYALTESPERTQNKQADVVLPRNSSELPLAEQINKSLSVENKEEENNQLSQVDTNILTERTDFTRKVVSLKADANRAQITQIVENLGGTVVGKAGNNSLVVKLPEDNLSESESFLAENSSIDNIETDYAVKLSSNVDWGVERVKAPEAWETVDGDGVTVAVLDTGIDSGHPEFTSNIVGGYDFVNNDSDPADGHGHGTAISGIIAAAQNDIGTIGVGKKANILAVKVLGDDGVGYISTVIAGIDWAVDNNAKVINMSLGTTYNSSSLKDAVDRAAASGVAVIAASGNNSGGPLLYPAAYDSVIAVGATNEDDSLASFSALGSELVAPGVRIAAPWLDGRYVSISGTSASAPHVSGLAALLLDHAVSDVRRALQKGTVDLGEEGYDSYYGYGLPEAPLVLALAKEDDEAPEVSFISPRDGQRIAGQQVINVKATDNREVLKVDLFINGELLSSSATSPYKWKWDIDKIEAGTYYLKARAFDEAGNTKEESIKVRVERKANQEQQEETNRATQRPTISPTITPRTNQGSSRDPAPTSTVPTPTISAPPQSSVEKIEPSSAEQEASPEPTVNNRGTNKVDPPKGRPR